MSSILLCCRVRMFWGQRCSWCGTDCTHIEKTVQHALSGSCAASCKKKETLRETLFGPARFPGCATDKTPGAAAQNTQQTPELAVQPDEWPRPKMPTGSGTACARVAATSRAHRTAACDHTRRAAAVMARRARASLLAQGADQITRNHVPLLSKYM